MKFYLGGPINGCTDEEAHGWREEVKTLLAEHGHTWLDPMDRDYRGREMEPGYAQMIVQGDKDDIYACDAVIANSPKPSYGTAMEIVYAYEMGVTVYVILPDDGKEPSPWIKFHCKEIYRGSVIEAVRKVIGA